jgi:phosphate transport system substrate-binding protein
MKKPFVAALCAGVLSLAAAQTESKIVGYGSSSYKTILEVNAKALGLPLEFTTGGTPTAKAKIIEDGLDFAVVEMPFTNEELKSANRPLVHIPFALYATVFAYNLPETKAQVRFSRANLAAIFLGKITRWDDPALLATNPDANLPNLPITLMLRTGSGPSSTIATVTDYLSKISFEWSSLVGAGPLFTPKWRAGNVTPTAIAKPFRETPGALTFYELNAALTNKFSIALLENASGKYVDANNRTAVSDAAADKPFPADTRTLVSDAGGNAYPLVSLSWIVIPKELNTKNRTPEQAQKLVEMLWRLINEGQNANEAAGYGRIPTLAVIRGQSLLRGVTFGGVRLR